MQKKDTNASNSHTRATEKKSGDFTRKIEPLQGGLVREMVLCGRSNCKCVNGSLHGPYHYRVWMVLGTQEKVDKELSHSLSWDVDNLSWYGLDHLFRDSPDLAEQVWDEVKEAAARDFMSGHFAAELFERTDWQKDVWKRAHFVAVFQMMIESYKPRDAIEHQMVEMAAVEYFLWRHWTAEHLQRATSEPRRESYDYEEWREKQKEVWCRRSGEKRPI